MAIVRTKCLLGSVAANSFVRCLRSSDRGFERCKTVLSATEEWPLLCVQYDLAMTGALAWQVKTVVMKDDLFLPRGRLHGALLPQGLLLLLLSRFLVIVCKVPYSLPSCIQKQREALQI